jgi:alpha-L-fucosidase
MNRLATFLALAIISMTSLVSFAAEAVDMDKRTNEVKNLKWGMFISWSFSSFSGKEHTPRVKDVALFNPQGCDTDQWARAAKEAGMGYILFLTKHHDGFCLWDTDTTDHKVTKSPLGKDVLAEVRKSCDKHGIKLALYISEGDWTWPGAKAWPADEKWPGTSKTACGRSPDLQKAQLKELCTQYGPIEFFWIDHAWITDPAANAGLSHKEIVDWIKQFQPGCFVGFNSGEPAGDIRLGEMGKPSALDDSSGPNFYGETNHNYRGYRLAEFTYPIYPKHPTAGIHWFYGTGPDADTACLPAEKLYKDYLGAVKYGNIFSLDVAPDRSGRLREIDVNTLQAVGRMIGESGGQ